MELFLEITTPCKVKKKSKLGKLVRWHSSHYHLSFVCATTSLVWSGVTLVLYARYLLNTNEGVTKTRSDPGNVTKQGGRVRAIFKKSSYLAVPTVNMDVQSGTLSVDLIFTRHRIKQSASSRVDASN